MKSTISKQLKSEGNGKAIPIYHHDLKSQSSKLIQKQVALLGGSFDPPTLSHIMIACEIYNQFDFIDEVWLVPCGDFRDDKNLKANCKHRINMLELIKNDIIYEDLPIHICNVEDENGKFMPTIDMLNKLKHDYNHITFYFCIGSDLALSILKWESGYEIINNYGIIIITRPGYEIVDLSYKDKCHILNTCLDLSSTVIRNRIEKFLMKKNKIHLGISGITSKSVLEYIYNNELYRVETECVISNHHHEVEYFDFDTIGQNK